MPEVSEEQRKQAWAAVNKLQSMLPQLRTFARIITGNPKINIKITHGSPQTRGNTISITPPLGLGKDYIHTRSQCGKRGDDGHQICKACDVREVIEFYLFHEIAHVAFNSSPKATQRDIDAALAYIDKYHPSEAECGHRQELTRAVMDTRRAPNPQNVGGVLTEFASMIFNCLEDARVNQRTFEARPGLRTVFDLNIDRLMTEGSETPSGHYILWKSANRDSQFMIGLNLLAAGYVVDEDRLAHSVVEALGDEKLGELCARAVEAADAHEILELSLEVLDHAQTLGYCMVEKCKAEEDEPLPSVDGCESDESAGTPSGAGDGESTGTQEGDNPPDPDGGSEPGQSDGPADSASSSGDGQESEESGEASDSSGGQSDPGSEDGTGSSSDGTPEEASEGDGGSSDSPDPGTSGLGDGTPGDAAEYETSAGSSPSSDDGESDEAADETDGRQGDRDTQQADESKESLDGSRDDNSDVRDDIKEGDPVEGDGYADEDSGDRSEPGSTGKHDLDSKESVDRDEDSSSSVSDELDGDDDNSDTQESDGITDDHGDPTDPWETAAPDVAERPFEAPSVDASDRSDDTLVSGTPDDVARDLARFLMHGYDGEPGLLDGLTDEDISDVLGIPGEGDILPPELETLIRVALQQVAFFDDPSMDVAGVSIVPYPHYGVRWVDATTPRMFHEPSEFEVSDHLIGRVVMEARRTFNDNRQARNERNLKSGRVDPRALGRRAPAGDPRMFRKRLQPGKKDYFVVIGADCSGSTIDFDRNAKIKRAVMAQGTILSRLGIEWAGYAHTAHYVPIETWEDWRRGTQFYLWMLPFKEQNEAWNDKTKTKLANVQPIAENLDGHTLQFYRKLAERSTATDKVIIYFTDGEMPAANATEEREILEREIKICKQQGITLLGVGINTDSPKHYGMDTVRIDSDADILKVVQQLGNRLMKDKN